MRRNMCTRLKGLGRLEDRGWCGHFLIGVKESFSGRTPVLTHRTCLAPGQQWTISFEIQAVIWLLLHSSFRRQSWRDTHSSHNKDIMLSPCKCWPPQDRTNKISLFSVLPLTLRNGCSQGMKQMAPYKCDWISNHLSLAQIRRVKTWTLQCDLHSMDAFCLHKGYTPTVHLSSLGISKPLCRSKMMQTHTLRLLLSFLLGFSSCKGWTAGFYLQTRL